MAVANDERWKPGVTVAAVVEQGGRYLREWLSAQAASGYVDSSQRPSGARLCSTNRSPTTVWRTT